MHVREDMWQSLTDPILPRTGEVDLWRVDLDREPACIDSFFAFLSTDEKARADKYVFARDRKHFIVGRATLRKIIGGYLGISPKEIRFSVRRFGKPYLSAEDGGLRFNVSHSRGIAFIAVSVNREVGVDIEFVDQNFDVFSVAPSVFSATEVLRIRSLPSNLQAATFFAGWTRREALLKAMGDGLSSSEELQAAVSLISNGDDSFRSFEANKFTNWSLTSLELDDDFKAALVVEGHIGHVRFLQSAGDTRQTLPSGRRVL